MLVRLRLRDPLGIVLLCGNRGVGKTQLAAKMIADYCRGLKAARYTTAIEFFLDLRGAMHNGDERRVLNEHARPQLLVIDDIHERGDSDWEDRMLTHLIDRRYRDLKDTILISNQTKAKALEALGPSVVDRLRECGGAIECQWESFRTATGASK